MLKCFHSWHHSCVANEYISQSVWLAGWKKIKICPEKFGLMRESHVFFSQLPQPINYRCISSFPGRTSNLWSLTISQSLLENVDCQLLWSKLTKRKEVKTSNSWWRISESSVCPESELLLTQILKSRDHCQAFKSAFKCFVLPFNQNRVNLFGATSVSEDVIQWANHICRIVWHHRPRSEQNYRTSPSLSPTNHHTEFTGTPWGMVVVGGSGEVQCQVRFCSM